VKYHCTEDLPILNALAQAYPNSSKSSLRSWLKEGRVSVNNELVKNSSFLVSKGQVILVAGRHKYVEERFPILYEDSDFIVIDKPAGLLSVSTAFEKSETAFSYLKRKYFPRQVYVVHRLDQETSGVMLFALSEQGLNSLKKLFEKHDLTRQYVAIVEGRMNIPDGLWESYLFEDKNYVVKSIPDSTKGERAVTHFRVDAASRAYSWLTLTLETGKKNQIRVHCQEAGHPVVGDKKYGAKNNPIKRLCLHAHLLAFDHPITKKPMKFVSPVPSNFYQLIEPAAGRKDA
jgi:tRNA pseudouridine32 synthase/23S rRNA pseudouridine746 synthase/23S rRNA pseudouridine1911/1915/1917 synthase